MAWIGTSRKLIDVWEFLSNGERHYLLKVAQQRVAPYITLGLLPLVEIDKLLPVIRQNKTFLLSNDDRRRFITKLIRKLT